MPCLMVYRLIKKLINYSYNKKRENYLLALKARGLRIGSNVDFAADFFIDPSHCYLISIGDNCTFSPNVRLISHDASTKIHTGYTKLGQVNIGDNCYLGDSVIILPNVTVGNDSIIAAGAVVTKNVPPRSIVAGVPAKLIGDMDSYIHKSKEEIGSRRVFSSDYRIENLNEAKIKELCLETRDGIAYIE